MALGFPVITLTEALQREMAKVVLWAKRSGQRPGLTSQCGALFPGGLILCFLYW